MKNRPERLICFLVVWLTMFSCISGKSQILLEKTDLTPDFKHLWLPGTNDMKMTSMAQGYHWNDHHLDLSREVVFAKTMNTDVEYAIPSNIYYLQSGFFCKREWELEKATHIPLRFRLGSLADCNALEGKH